MDWNDDHLVIQEETKLLSKMGCLFWIVLLGLCMMWYPSKMIYHVFFPPEKQLLVSDSPNRKNQIKVVARKDDFPKPLLTIKIQYGDTNIDRIIRTKKNIDIRSEHVSVKWENDDKASVVIQVEDHEPIMQEIMFD